MDPSLQSFSQRAAARFSGVGGDKSAGLTLTCAPCRPGQHEIKGCSSDEDDGGHGSPRPEPSLLSWRLVTNGAVDKSGKALAEISSASRQAFEEEADEDEFDVIATGSLSKAFQEEMPAKGTEVVQVDNAWEKNCARDETTSSKARQGNNCCIHGCTSEGQASQSIHKQTQAWHAGGWSNSRQLQNESFLKKDHETIGEEDEKSNPEDVQRFVPEFGSGIEYRPSMQCGGEEGKPPCDKPSSIPPALVSMSTFDEDSIHHSEAPHHTTEIPASEDSTVKFRPRSQGKRQYRSGRKFQG